MMSDRKSPKNLKLNNRSSGFTFIELLVVTMILGIIAAVGILQSSNNMGGFSDRISMDQLISDINYAQTSAIARRETVSMVFNINSDSYSVYLGSISEENKFKSFPNGLDGVVEMNDLQLGGVDLTSADFSSSSTLQFLPSGSPAAGGTIVLNGTVLSIQSETGKCVLN